MELWHFLQGIHHHYLILLREVKTSGIFFFFTLMWQVRKLTYREVNQYEQGRRASWCQIRIQVPTRSLDCMYSGSQWGSLGVGEWAILYYARLSQTLQDILNPWPWPGAIMWKSLVTTKMLPPHISTYTLGGIRNAPDREQWSLIPSHIDGKMKTPEAEGT